MMTVPFSIIKALYYFISFKLWFPGKNREKVILMEDGIAFKIFRHMRLKTPATNPGGVILIVRFKFRQFSHKTNIRLSRIPILMIAGFPGFQDKIWMIDWKTDYWQGVYQFKNAEAIKQYKGSFVLGIMNKRAQKETLSYQIIPNQDIDTYLKKRFVS